MQKGLAENEVKAQTGQIKNILKKAEEEAELLERKL